MKRNGRITDAERAVEEIRDIRRDLWAAGPKSPSELLRRLTAESGRKSSQSGRLSSKASKNLSKGASRRPGG